MRGKATSYLMSCGISNSRQRFFTPRLFIFGEIAKQIPPPPLLASATTRLVSKGFSPLSAHSTDAKKHFMSMQKYVLVFCAMFLLFCFGVMVCCFKFATPCCQIVRFVGKRWLVCKLQKLHPVCHKRLVWCKWCVELPFATNCPPVCQKSSFCHGIVAQSAVCRTFGTPCVAKTQGAFWQVTSLLLWVFSTNPTCCSLCSFALC